MKNKTILSLAGLFAISILLISKVTAQNQLIPNRAGGLLADSISLTLQMCPNMIICSSQTVQIYGIASGGTGNYNYSWSPTDWLSDPTISDPMASPDSTITYTLTVNDGIDSIIDSVKIVVFPCPTPEITAFPNDTVDVNDSILLSAGSGYLGYQWLDGSTDSTYIATNSSGPNGGEQVYWVKVFGASGCQGYDTIHVWFLPLTETIEFKSNDIVGIFPNPSKDKIKISFKNYSENIRIQILRINGREVFDNFYNDFGHEHSFDIDISSLPGGIYLLKIQNEDGIITSTSKFVKQ